MVKTNTTKWAWVLALLLPAAACGPDASSDAYERTSHACAPGVCPEASAPPATFDAAAGNEPLEPWPDSNAGLTSGVYAMHASATATVGPVMVSLQLLYRLRILQQTSGAANVKQSTTLCALELPSVKGIATLSIPPRLQALIPEKSAVVSEGDFLSAVGATQTYAPPPLLLVLGARLQNPATDPLPSLTDPTEQWDEDADGHPGVTIDGTVFTCTAPQQLYVALRTAGTFTGTVTGFDTIDGTIAISESESVIGYSDPCLSAASELSPKLSPTSAFHAVRLADEAQLDATGNVSCADIVAQAPKLFSTWAN